MVTYEENMEVVRRDPLKDISQNSKGKTVWNLVSEVPLQWLEDMRGNGEFLPTYAPATNLNQDEDIYGIAFYADGSVASGFQIEATDPEFLGEKEANSIHNHLEAALTTLNKEDNLHFIWTALDEDEDTLGNFIRDRDGLETHPIQHYVRKEIIARERKRLNAGNLKSYKSYCFLNSPYQGKTEEGKSSVLSHLAKAFKDIPELILNAGNLASFQKKTPERDALALLAQKNLASMRSIMAGFAGCPGITVRPLNSTQIYRMVRRTWSPTQWKNDKLIEGKTLESLYSPLKYALPSYYLLEEIEDKWGWTWKTGRTWHRMLSLRIPPEFSDIGTMISQMVAKDNYQIYNSEYSLTLRPSSGAKAAEALHANLKLYRKQFEGNPREHENLLPIINDMSNQLAKLTQSDGSFVFQTFLFIHIWHEDQKTLDTWEGGLLRTFSMAPLKARLSIEQFNSLPYYIGFGTPGFTRCQDVHRGFTYLSTEAVTHIPLLGQSDGYIQADHKNRRAPNLMETHRGTLYAQDDFARGRVLAYNGCAVGTSGSGKSLYYNLKLARTFSNRDIIIVLDGAVANGSYRSLAKMLAGSDSYIETGLEQGEATHTVNPLFTEELPDKSYRAPNPDEVASMVNRIEPMVRERPGMTLNERDRAQIAAAINLAFENFRDENGKVFLRSVAKALREKGNDIRDTASQRARDMALHLAEQWCWPKGTYRYFVDRESTRSPRNLTVYDLKGISQDDTLKGVMVANYLAHIDSIVAENMKKPAEERSRIWVIIDEAWSALMDPVMVRPLTGLYRAGRARNISVHCLTQQMADFKKILINSDPSTGGTTYDPNNNSILGNTTWFNLFKHDPQDVKITQEVLGLPDNQTHSIETLGSQPGKYREMIQYVRLMNGTAFNKVLVRPLPWELHAYSSDDRDRGEAETIRREILKGWANPEEAVKSRNRAVAELQEAGFDYANEQLDDTQVIEILTALRQSRQP